MSAIRRGLTVPPIEAPVLPAGYFYKIRMQDSRDHDHPNWIVTVLKHHRLWNEMVSRGWSDSRTIPTEENLTSACVNAYDAMAAKLGHGLLKEKHAGRWSGQ